MNSSLKMMRPLFFKIFYSSIYQLVCIYKNGSFHFVEISSHDFLNSYICICKDRLVNVCMCEKTIYLINIELYQMLLYK